MRVLWGVLFFTAAVFRLFQLELKPIHFDEGVNGWWIERVWEKGFYPYDPTNYHGPLFFYLAQFSEGLFGFGIWSIRFVSVAAALGTVYLLYSHQKWLGRYTWVSALIIAVSPAFVFFSRSGIHESLFVFFQFTVFCGVLRFWHDTSSRLSWNMIFAGLAGAFLTKETWVLTLAAAVLAAAVFLPLTKRTWQNKIKQLDWKVIGRDFSIWLLLLLFFCFEYTASGDGPWRFVTAFLPWAKTGMNSGHDKSVFYWVELMAQFEWPLLFAMGSVAFLSLKRSLFQLGFAVFAFALLLVYSIIPYKTPWCSISVFWPLALLLPVAMESVPDSMSRYIAAILVVLCGVSAWQSYKLNFRNYASDGQPYVYVQTTREMGSFYRHLTDMQKRDPAVSNWPIVFLISDSWPIPYMFQRFTSVRYGLKGETPKLLLVDPKHRKKVREEFPEFAERKLRIRWAKDHSILFYNPEFVSFEGIL